MLCVRTLYNAVNKHNAFGGCVMRNMILSVDSAEFNFIV